MESVASLLHTIEMERFLSAFEGKVYNIAGSSGGCDSISENEID